MLMKIRLPQVFLTLSTIHLYINKSGPTRPEGKFGPMTKRVTWTLKEHRASVPYHSVNTCKLNHSAVCSDLLQLFSRKRALFIECINALYASLETRRIICGDLANFQSTIVDDR